MSQTRHALHRRPPVRTWNTDFSGLGAAWPRPQIQASPSSPAPGRPAGPRPTSPLISLTAFSEPLRQGVHGRYLRPRRTSVSARPPSRRPCRTGSATAWLRRKQLHSPSSPEFEAQSCHVGWQDTTEAPPQGREWRPASASAAARKPCSAGQHHARTSTRPHGTRCSPLAPSCCEANDGVLLLQHVGTQKERLDIVDEAWPPMPTCATYGGR